MNSVIIKTITFLFIGFTAYTQAPTWSVNENNFEHTMSFVAFLNVDGSTLQSTNDKLAAFVGSECRGVTNLIYVVSKDRYYAYINVFSNTNGEQLTFKVYDSTNDKIVDIDKTVDFEINALQGSLSQAFSFASPPLSDKAEIINFNFKDVTVLNASTEGNIMTFYVDNGIDISALTPVFELDTGAQMFSGDKKIISDTSLLDFSKPVMLDIVSQDESIKKQWEVRLKYNTALGNLAFYKKDAVCYKGGVIKVVSSNNGGKVELQKEKVAYAVQLVANGEAVFSNLEPGSYTAKVNGFEKEIKINLKN